MLERRCLPKRWQFERRRAKPCLTFNICRALVALAGQGVISQDVMLKTTQHRDREVLRPDTRSGVRKTLVMWAWAWHSVQFAAGLEVSLPPVRRESRFLTVVRLSAFAGFRLKVFRSTQDVTYRARFVVREFCGCTGLPELSSRGEMKTAIHLARPAILAVSKGPQSQSRCCLTV